jgi:FkbM family methyltransferase
LNQMQPEKLLPASNIAAPNDAVAAIRLDVDSPWGTYRPHFWARLIVELARRTFLNHGSFRRVLSRWLYRLHPGPLDYAVWGHPLRLYPHENVSDRKALFRPHRFDPRELAQLASAVQPDGHITFVDIGANAGFYSLFLLSHAADPTILAFEPHPVIFRRLEHNLRFFARQGVHLFPYALGDAEGVATLQLAGGSSHIGEGDAGVEVRVRKLMDVLSEQGIVRIDVLKIDVEGYEDCVLEPFFAEAPEELRPRHIIIEHLSRARWRYDCIGAAVKLGYRIGVTTGNNTVLSL